MRLRSVGILLVCLLSVVSAVRAQSSTSKPADTDTEKSKVGSAVPGVGDILDVIDKATTQDPKDKKADDAGWSAPVRLAVVFAFLALLPSLLVMMTSFTRIIIVLSFVRRALSTQNIPPNVAIIGLALFLTIFTMAPVFGDINTQALKPYMADKLEFTKAVEKGNDLLRDFMIRQTRTSDLELFIEMADMPAPETAADVPMHVAIPAFAISEFRTAFEMGCLLFIPFLLIDLVVGGILLSAGMMMLPPALVSLPFKIILFVLVDGWRLLVQTLVMSFQ
ncbi:MAG: flagellar type III secretion system pore protein FliP [Phycisphaerae bacterium]|nr:flagellar type III secretion system pore protein FliP [Phycisphaerae bacterium]